MFVLVTFGNIWLHLAYLVCITIFCGQPSLTSLLGSIFASHGIFFVSVLAWFFAWVFLQPLDQYKTLLLGRFIRWYYSFLSFWGCRHVEGWIIIIMPRIGMVVAAWLFRVSAFLGYLSRTQHAEACTMSQLKAVWPCSAWHWAQANISCPSAGLVGSVLMPYQASSCAFSAHPRRWAKQGCTCLQFAVYFLQSTLLRSSLFSSRFSFLMGKAVSSDSGINSIFQD